MEATLLSGMYAPTAESGKSFSHARLIRSRICILPNHVKGDLKGCFIMSRPTDPLPTKGSRRLTTCHVSPERPVRHRPEDQGIRGRRGRFVGLRGKVVSKMGSAIARSLVAGFAVGFEMP